MDLEPIKKEILKQVEAFLVAQFENGNFDLAVVQLKAKLQEAIPGKVDDVVLDALFPVLMPLLKQALLEQIKKISE